MQTKEPPKCYTYIKQFKTMKSPIYYRLISFNFRIGDKKTAYKIYKALPDQEKKNVYVDAFNNWPDTTKYNKRLGKFLDLM